MSLSDFTTSGRGSTTGYSTSDPTLAFVDMEGQGDKSSTDHDVRLATPFLLASKFVMYNWMSLSNKHKILEELEVMVQAADKVAEENDKGQPNFGHLIILVRDFGGSERAEEVKKLVLDNEEAGGGRTKLKERRALDERNSIHEGLREGFASITVHAIPRPHPDRIACSRRPTSGEPDRLALTAWSLLTTWWTVFSGIPDSIVQEQQQDLTKRIALAAEVVCRNREEKRRELDKRMEAIIVHKSQASITKEVGELEFPMDETALSTMWDQLFSSHFKELERKGQTTATKDGETDAVLLEELEWSPSAAKLKTLVEGVYTHMQELNRMALAGQHDKKAKAKAEKKPKNSQGSQESWASRSPWPSKKPRELGKRPPKPVHRPAGKRLPSKSKPPASQRCRADRACHRCQVGTHGAHNPSGRATLLQGAH
eukprot:g12968.t1